MRKLTEMIEERSRELRGKREKKSHSFHNRPFTPFPLEIVVHNSQGFGCYELLLIASTFPQIAPFQLTNNAAQSTTFLATL